MKFKRMMHLFYKFSFQDNKNNIILQKNKNMATITIKNVGPIKSVENLEINKVNVFMGQQSSGKSTIAKIISFCTWVEKRRMLDGFFRENFLECLKTFHNFEDTYFPSNAFFRYEGKYCNLEFSKMNKPNGEVFIKENIMLFENRKNIFIPAERNFVASIPNLGRYKETNNNVMNFLYDWYEAKKHYQKNNMLNIPELDISYYHIENEDRDKVIFCKEKEIILRNASSGIQSMLPLYLLMDYMTNGLFKNETVLSPFEKEQLKELAKPMMEAELEKITETQLEAEYHEIKERIETGCKIEGDEFYLDIANYLKERKNDELLNFIINKMIISRKYHFSQFIIEEPEQNLFPSTQRDLVYHFLKLVTGKRDHRLTITTHSPYILYALNNCMMGKLIFDKMDEEDRDAIVCKSSLINPKDVSIYQIEDGILKNIQQEDGLIVSNFFDEKMKEIMDDFYILLKYYDDEK